MQHLKLSCLASCSGSSRRPAWPLAPRLRRVPLSSTRRSRARRRPPRRRTPSRLMSKVRRSGPGRRVLLRRPAPRSWRRMGGDDQPPHPRLRPVRSAALLLSPGLLLLRRRPARLRLHGPDVQLLRRSPGRGLLRRRLVLHDRPALPLVAAVVAVLHDRRTLVLLERPVRSVLLVLLAVLLVLLPQLLPVVLRGRALLPDVACGPGDHAGPADELARIARRRRERRARRRLARSAGTGRDWSPAIVWRLWRARRRLARRCAEHRNDGGCSGGWHGAPVPSTTSPLHSAPPGGGWHSAPAPSTGGGWHAPSGGGWHGSPGGGTFRPPSTGGGGWHSSPGGGFHGGGGGFRGGGGGWRR
jgi:hypothetical protein